ncbi:MAG: HmuY family protein [Marinoscillum sp.]
MKLKLVLFVCIFFILSCDDDNDLMSIEAMIVTNLYAPEFIGNGPNQQSANFIKFSFKDQTTTEGDNWDIAFRGTKILVNGGFPGSNYEPARTGLAAGYITIGNYGGIKSVNENLLNQDSETQKAIPSTNGGWYEINNNAILPYSDKTLVFKTHNSRYAKVKIVSFYKDAPENINPFSSKLEYYTFSYTYQPNENVITF